MIDYDKVGRDAVAAERVKGTGPAALARTVCGEISSAARASKDTQKAAVVAVVRGALTSVFLGGQDLVETSIQVLAYLPNISLMTTAGASDLMSWVMEGIADVTPVAGPEARDKIAARIDEKFMGAGEVFAALCAKAK